MYYYVCFQNCIEDYYCENAQSLRFQTMDEAQSYVDSLNADSNTPVFKITGEIRWYFPSCDSKGCLCSPNIEEDCLECYQIINIIPDSNEDRFITECYDNDPDAVISRIKRYTLDYLGNVSEPRISEVKYLKGV